MKLKQNALICRKIKNDFYFSFSFKWNHFVCILYSLSMVDIKLKPNR